MTLVDLLVSQPHYADHLQPIWRALPDEQRGDVYTTPSIASRFPGAMPLKSGGKDPDRLTLVAGHPDLLRLKHRTGVFVEHGIGQSYSAQKGSAAVHPAHPGGRNRDKAALFLCPNEYAASRERKAYPRAQVEIIGSPRLAELQTIRRDPPGKKPTVCVSTHWYSMVARESGSAWPHWYRAFADLAQNPDYEVIGHAHPRLFPQLVRHYERMGIEPVASFTDVIRRASVYCFDNSSSGYECAAVGIPVVVLDAPWYRQGTSHGLRFWDAADIGPRIIDQDALPNAVKSTLTKQPWPGAEERLARVFPAVENPAVYAAEIIVDTLSRRPVLVH